MGKGKEAIWGKHPSGTMNYMNQAKQLMVPEGCSPHTISFSALLSCLANQCWPQHQVTDGLNGHWERGAVGKSKGQLPTRLGNLGCLHSNADALMR